MFRHPFLWGGRYCLNRSGVVTAPSVWWRKLSGDGGNANAVTSQALTDLGGGPTFYDCLVEVSRVTQA